MTFANTERIEKNSEVIVYATGAAAMNETLTPGYPFELKEVRLHLSAVGGSSENFTITEDAYEGAAYDVVHFSQDMEAVSDVVQSYYNKEKHFGSGDKLVFAYANTNTKTWGLKIVYKLLLS